MREREPSNIDAVWDAACSAHGLLPDLSTVEPEDVAFPEDDDDDNADCFDMGDEEYTRTQMVAAGYDPDDPEQRATWDRHWNPTLSGQE